MTGIDDFLYRQREIIDRVGWVLTLVVPSDDEPDDTAPFAYTVGLTAHDYPVLIIAGLDPATSQALLNDLASRVYDKGELFRHGQRIGDLVAGYDAVIIDGDSTEQLHPGGAIGRYGRDRVGLQQVVWPDRRGRFPWETAYALPPPCSR
ncbi:DUF4262 domain-containing protein [Micromonospora fulviviridis]|uniref:DUF4262 domain-containing protein n=1 Tax=Micromonospora fulviviridis TaxID=47860 RepID=UPI001665CFF1|nr:DUF4262 domain-containing protein [Micromonospora fulviviridis]